MRIFVTGATGFVGNNLGNYLLKQGHHVICLIHDWTNLGKESQTLWESGKVNWCFGDVRDFKRMREILYNYKPDAIVHLAAQAIVGKAHVDPYSTFDVNVNGTVSLLQAWREAAPNAQFVYFSTDKVYGNGLNKKETDPIISTNDPYQASKAAADIIAQSYGATVTRSCNIYGLGDRETSRLVPSVIQNFLKGEYTTIRNPTFKREYIYIEDLCKILSWLLEQRKIGIWNIGSGKIASVQEIVKTIRTHFPVTSHDFDYPLNQAKLAELEEQSLDTHKLCLEMDCLAFTILQAGIRKTVEWWRTQHPLLSSPAA